MTDLTRPALHPIHLVGAGPGDPELLTLKALRVLRAATVILVDDLVGEGVLALALADLPSPPRLVHVGKRGGCASTPQEFIEKLLVREALAGERVVRLKGGDPLVFGRAGEEIAALRDAGLQVEIVNGITSGLSAAASLGIGWTDRRFDAQGVLLVTGHTRHDCEGRDWDAVSRVAASGVTLVIYMGIAQIETIVAQLLRVLPADLPAAVVQHASTDRERTARATLASLVDTVAAHGIGSPAVLIIGRVTEEARSAAGLAEAQDRTYVTS
ncbi:MAG TPA: uroporphyrinogen-III C-methyltransferase [Burkholderiaceae bacterium]|jgi:uroporphyrin-III C-methyltransferase